MENHLNHVGIIMDGNRRWARRHALTSVLEGHSRGAYHLIDFCEWCKDAGIRYVSASAFSTENWKRNTYEVEGLFDIAERFFVEKIDHVIRKGVRVHIVGNRGMLSEKTRATVEKAEQLTADCKDLTLLIALSYGGRDELVRGVRDCCEAVRAGKLSPDQIDETTFRSFLETKDYPDIDLVIRTGGQHRLSNFFPWETAYSEFYFTDVLWPDFDRKQFDLACKYYENVQINLGK